MADTKISALTALTGANVATGDQLPIVDASAATTKSITADELARASVFTSRYLALVAGGANVENVGAIESDVSTVGSTGSTETLDTSEYAVFDVTMDQSCTFTFSNPAPSGDCTVFVLILRGAFTPTFPAAVDWGDAAAPTYTTPSIYTFTTVNAGTVWFGAQVGKAFA
jgi:hypothetical protein